MHPMDVSGRRLLARERYEAFERDARPALRTAGRTRRRVGGLLVAAGLRLAPECAPGRGAVA
jgi:hypothetical protein